MKDREAAMNTEISRLKLENSKINSLKGQIQECETSLKRAVDVAEDLRESNVGLTFRNDELELDKRSLSDQLKLKQSVDPSKIYSEIEMIEFLEMAKLRYMESFEVQLSTLKTEMAGLQTMIMDSKHSMTMRTLYDNELETWIDLLKSDVLRCENWVENVWEEIEVINEGACEVEVQCAVQHLEKIFRDEEMQTEADFRPIETIDVSFESPIQAQPDASLIFGKSTLETWKIDEFEKSNPTSTIKWRHQLLWGILIVCLYLYDPIDLFANVVPL